MDLGDLFGLLKHLDPRRRGQQEAAIEEFKRKAMPPIVRLPGEGEGVAFAGDVPALPRPRIATPPEPAPPLALATGPAVTLPPDLGLAGEAPPLPRPVVGLVGGDVDPREAGMGTRPRIADPLSYRANRVAEMAAEPAAKSRHSRLYEAGAGFLRGFASGGLGGALYGAGMGAADPDSVARMRQQEELEREQNAFARLYQNRKAQTDLEGDQLSNEVRAAQIPYLLARPEIEANKLDSLNDYRAGQLDLRRDANESLADYRNRTLGQRKDAAESLEEYRDRMITLGERRAAQGDRRLTESERHNRVNEALGGERVRQGDERIDIAREGLTLRERFAAGNLDARWASVAQGYDRLDASRQKQVDALAEKAAKAEAEAAYFESTDKPAAEMRRKQAAEYRRQAEAVTSRPAPRVQRPTAAPPISEEDFVKGARQRMGAQFDEGKAREAYRRRYGR